MRLRGFKRFFRSGAPSPEKGGIRMSPSRELQGKHDAQAEVSEIPSPESELATPSDEDIFELPHERSLRLTPSRSSTVDLPERTRDDTVPSPSTASIAENSEEQERGRSPTRAKVFTSANDEHTPTVPSTIDVPDILSNQASNPQQTELDNTSIPKPERTSDNIVPSTASMAEDPRERGPSPPRRVFTLADCKPCYIVPPNLPVKTDEQELRLQRQQILLEQIEAERSAAAETHDATPERAVRTNLPNISTNQNSGQDFVPVFDDSPGESDNAVAQSDAKSGERKDSALAQPAVDTSGVPPLRIHDKLKKLVPYATPLSIRDLDRCFALENDCFFGRNYCTKEQLAYRLTHGSSYSIGIFISTTAESSPVATFAAARSPDSSQPKRRALLIGHIIATKTNNDRIVDADLRIGGHRNDGNNLAINNVAVLHDYRRLGVFTLLMKEFVIRMHQAAVAEKCLLLSRKPYIPLFQHLRFEYRGQSSVAIGDENWYDMALVFKSLGTPLSPSKYEPAEEEDGVVGELPRPSSRHRLD